MRIVDQLRAVRHTFAANRARSALTLLGIMIGAGSIVLLAGLLRGGQEMLLYSQQAASETDIIRVNPDDAPVKQRGRTQRNLSLQDQEVLGESRLLENDPTTALMFRGGRALWKDRKKDVTLNGVTPTTLNLYRLKLQQGRFIDDDDIDKRRRVAVVGQDVWADLLQKESSTDGIEIEVEGHRWQVVGVLKDKPFVGGEMGTWMWNRRVIVPNTTFDSLFSTTHAVGAIFVRAGAHGSVGDRLQAVKNVVESTLLRRHLGVKNFKVDGGEGERSQMNIILMVIKVLLLGTGILSLFVGGINIMNIMLVTVTERTREIGIRRAVGATPTAVMMQFLLEAAFIALTGGVVGVLGGIGFTWLTAFGLTHAFGAWPMHIEPWAVTLGLLLSAMTGVVFGLFPAWRAARLDPVEALRYE
jgi:putative ABC transport system permease protein